MRKKKVINANAVADSADLQHYYSSLSQRLALPDSEANAVIAGLIDTIDREAIDDITSCPPNPIGGFPGVTSNRFYYLSEIVGNDVSDASAGAALACFLSQIVAHQVNPENNPPQIHSNATLVVDRACVVRQTLTLPDRFTLAGVGPDGEGTLTFDLPDNASALRFAPASDAAIRMTTIRDIRISGVSCCGQVGINVSNSQFVYIDRVRLSGFAIGIFGETAFSVFIANSSIHDNGFVNMVMGEDTTAWRVRDAVLSSGLIGILITTTARGHVITGARIERNSVTGVWVNGSMNVIENSWFEGNGTMPTPLPGIPGTPSPSLHGIRITSLAEKTRVLNNLFSSQLIGDAGAETRSCFNVSFAPLSGDVNQLRCQ
jgi:Right handed beta helix region